MVVVCAVTALAATGCIVWLALASDHVEEPGIQAALMIWVVLLYVVAGLLACWLRPGRFGLLMVAAGFAIFLSTISWANAPVPFTIGITFDLLPAVLFLHVYLAYPSGRLRSTFQTLSSS